MLLSALLFGVGVGFVAWALWLFAKESLSRKDGTLTDAGESLSSAMRVARRTGRVTLTLMGRARLAKRLAKDQELLTKAGHIPGWEDTDLLGMQIAGVALGCFVGFFGLHAPLWMVGVLGLCGWWFPRRRIQQRRIERQADITRRFPTAIDIVTLGLQGGLDFLSGIREVTASFDPGEPLAQELMLLQTRISTGSSRAQALRALSQRVDAVEVKTAITALVQADEVGTGIVETLRVQAEQLRFSRLMRAEEEANKVPTKMLMPLFLFILPAVLIVIFTPIIMTIAQAFRGMGQ